jgi:hypothetical protein
MMEGKWREIEKAEEEETKLEPKTDYKGSKEERSKESKATNKK